MRTFEQLTVKERERALVASRAAIVEGVVCGILEIELVDSHNQRTLDIILKDAVEKDAPRLAMLRIFNNKAICKEINKLALVAASETVYDEQGIRVLEGRLQ